MNTTRKTLTQTEKIEIIKVANPNAKRVAEIFEVSVDQVRRLYTKHGIAYNGMRTGDKGFKKTVAATVLTDAQRDELVMYWSKDGYSFKELADMFKISEKEVAEIIESYGYDLNEGKEEPKHEVEVENKVTAGKVDGLKHKAFNEISVVTQIEKQAYLAGPAGTGKTTIAEQVAESLDLDFGYISCSGGLSEAHLLGRMLFDGEYVPAKFVEIFENGGVFLFDEVDAADSNMLLVINSALANGKLSIPNRKDKPFAERHEDCIILCAANTWGAGGAGYHGRNHLDAAFLDRFSNSRVAVEYDTALENKLAKAQGVDFAAEMIHKLRANIQRSKLNRIVSTRAIISTAKQIKFGQTVEQVLDRLTQGWTREEMAKAGIADLKATYGAK